MASKVLDLVHESDWLAGWLAAPAAQQHPGGSHLHGGSAPALVAHFTVPAALHMPAQHSAC